MCNSNNITLDLKVSMYSYDWESLILNNNDCYCKIVIVVIVKIKYISSSTFISILLETVCEALPRATTYTFYYVIIFISFDYQTDMLIKCQTSIILHDY